MPSMRHRLRTVNSQQHPVEFAFERGTGKRGNRLHLVSHRTLTFAETQELGREHKAAQA